jgi:hypothetical protein
MPETLTVGTLITVSTPPNVRASAGLTSSLVDRELPMIKRRPIRGQNTWACHFFEERVTFFLCGKFFVLNS